MSKILDNGKKGIKGIAVLDYSYYEGFREGYFEAVETTLGLCRGRHEIPQVDNRYIFDEVFDPMDFDGLQEQALEFLRPLQKEGVNLINLYVTGLTPCLIASINACKLLGLAVDLYHFNRETGDYEVQEVTLYW